MSADADIAPSAPPGIADGGQYAKTLPPMCAKMIPPRFSIAAITIVVTRFKLATTSAGETRSLKFATPRESAINIAPVPEKLARSLFLGSKTFFKAENILRCPTLLSSAPPEGERRMRRLVGRLSHGAKIPCLGVHGVNVCPGKWDSMI